MECTARAGKPYERRKPLTASIICDGEVIPCWASGCADTFPVTAKNQVSANIRRSTARQRFFSIDQAKYLFFHFKGDIEGGAEQNSVRVCQAPGAGIWPIATRGGHADSKFGPRTHFNDLLDL